MKNDDKKNKVSFRQLEILPKIEKAADRRRARRWIFVFLAVTALSSAVFWLIASPPSLKVLQLTSSQESSLEIPKTDEASDQDNQKVKKSPEELAVLISERLKDKKGSWAIWVEELEGEFSWSLNGEKVFQAASLIKIPVVLSLFREVERGNLSLEKTVALTALDKREGAGSLYLKPVGSVFNLNSLVYASLQQSDNTAFTVLRRVLTDETIQNSIVEMGMKNTSLLENETTAADIALGFRDVYNQKLIPAYRSQFFEDLTKTAFETRIPAGVPEGISVAHKVGTDIGVSHDAGIVFVPENPILMIFLSENTDTTTSDEVIADLTKEAYWFLLQDRYH